MSGAEGGAGAVMEAYERQYREVSAALASVQASAADRRASLEEAESLVRGPRLPLAAQIRFRGSILGAVPCVLMAAAAAAADGGGGAGDQRARLLSATERLTATGERIRDGKRTLLETEELGVSILQDLHQQRQTLLHARDSLHGVDDNIGRSRQILNGMARRMNRNKWVMGLIIFILIAAIVLIVYVRLRGHR
eukprot:SM000185S04018  [mRNA]  locus=s185:84270:85304:+ [translate_table: standard]